MLKHYEREIVRLKQSITDLGLLVEQQLKASYTAVVEFDADKAKQVIDADDEIDRIEVELEEECLKLLALHQPLAGDLRFIIAVLKINNDLERIGDIAVNVARRAARLSRLQRVELPEQLEEEARRAKLMLRKALLALVEVDAELARDVLTNYRQLEELNRKSHRSSIERIKQNADRAEEHILVLSIAKRFERVGDLTCNIAEDVIYMVEGEIVRHARDRLPGASDT